MSVTVAGEVRNNSLCLTIKSEIMRGFEYKKAREGGVEHAGTFSITFDEVEHSLKGFQRIRETLDMLEAMEKEKGTQGFTPQNQPITSSS
jgi:hypothetical protein